MPERILKPEYYLPLGCFLPPEYCLPPECLLLPECYLTPSSGVNIKITRFLSGAFFLLGFTLFAPDSFLVNIFSLIA